MKFRRKPNPNRNHPLYCPYCAGEGLFPDEETEFAWSCSECLRVFSVQFHGQDEQEAAPEPAVSTNEALQNSLHKSAVKPVQKSPQGPVQKSSLNFLNVSRGTSGTEQSYRDPEQSPAGASTTTEPLADDIAARNRQLVTDYADALYDASAEDILAWADEHVPGEIAVTMSMENTVLAELASRYAPRASLLFLDTGYHFDETLDVAKQVQQRYDQQFITATPTLNRNEQDEVYGPRLYASNPTACCRMRKVEPLARNLSPFAGWVTGLRRDDGPTRAQAPALSLDDTGRLKISPLVTWSLQDTEDYVDKHDLIVHPLTRQGYPSIGCATCTLPVAEGQDPRAGRWAGLNKTECGLHT